VNQATKRSPQRIKDSDEMNQIVATKKNKKKKRKFYCLSATFSESKFVAIESSISEYSQAPKYLKASRVTEFLEQNKDKEAKSLAK
jgi:hypothetical protein